MTGSAECVIVNPSWQTSTGSSTSGCSASRGAITLRVRVEGRPAHVGQAHLGVNAASLPLVRESIASHRLVDVDLALEELAAADPRAELLGIEGGQERQHEDFAGLLRKLRQARS